MSSHFAQQILTKLFWAIKHCLKFFLSIYHIIKIDCCKNIDFNIDRLIE
jgi:hypothetical protein